MSLGWNNLANETADTSLLSALALCGTNTVGTVVWIDGKRSDRGLLFFDIHRSAAFHSLHGSTDESLNGN